MINLKRFWRKSKFYFQVFLEILLTLAVLVVGFSMAFTSVNLSEEQQFDGIITAITTQQTKGSKAIQGRKDLILKINNRSEEYLIYRSSQNYNDILSAVRSGDSVKLYFGFYRQQYNDYTIYQLQSGGKIIYSKDEYEAREQFAGRFIAIPGGFFMLAVVIYRMKKQYKTNNINI